MAFKTLTSFATTPETLQRVLGPSVALARHWDSHLDICCIGVDYTQPGNFYAGAPAVLYQEGIDRALSAAETMERSAREHMAREDLRCTVEALAAPTGGLPALVGMRARFADLVVLPRPLGEGRRVEEPAVVEAALFDGCTAVLVLPDAGLALVPPGRRIVLAWNQSNEALSATRRALPLLKAAEHVDIAVIDPPGHGPEGEAPGRLLSRMLTRHGVPTGISILARGAGKVADQLTQHMRDLDADLLVMGAYGRSRLREAILGGVTRQMLQSGEVAVFMAR